MALHIGLYVSVLLVYSSVCLLIIYQFPSVISMYLLSSFLWAMGQTGYVLGGGGGGGGGGVVNQQLCL